MDRKNTLAIGIVIGLAVLGFLFVLFRSFMLGGNAPEEEATFPSPQSVPIETIITATHAYQNGEHLLSGVILLPTPCHLLEHTVTILPDGSRATIAFTRAFTGGDCPGGERQAPFLVKFTAPESTIIRATLDGREVTLSIREAAPGENLENTEVFLKG